MTDPDGTPAVTVYWTVQNERTNQVVIQGHASLTLRSASSGYYAGSIPTNPTWVSFGRRPRYRRQGHVLVRLT